MTQPPRDAPTGSIEITWDDTLPFVLCWQVCGLVTWQVLHAAMQTSWAMRLALVETRVDVIVAPYESIIPPDALTMVRRLHTMLRAAETQFLANAPKGLIVVLAQPHGLTTPVMRLALSLYPLRRWRLAADLASARALIAAHRDAPPPTQQDAHA